MKSISFFSPVYYVESENNLKTEGYALSLARKTCQTIINAVEYVFAFGKAYAIESPTLNSTPSITRYKAGDVSNSAQLIRVVLAIILVAVIIYYPPVLILPLILTCIKLCNFLSQPLLPQKCLKEVEISGQSSSSDYDIAQKAFIAELKSLKKDGKIYALLECEINHINSEKNLARASTLYKALSIFQSHCKGVLENPEFSESAQVVKNALISLSLLKSQIDSAIKGIPNITNSCYMNASLQGLFAIPEICRQILHLDVGSVPEEKKQILKALKSFLIAYMDPEIGSLDLRSHAKKLREAFYDSGDIENTPSASQLKKIIADLSSNNENDLLSGFCQKFKALKAEEIIRQNDAIVIVNSVLELLGKGVPKVDTKTPNEKKLSPIKKSTSLTSLVNPALVEGPAPTYLLLPMEKMIEEKKVNLRDFIDDYFKVNEEGDEKNQLSTFDSETLLEAKSSSWKEQIFLIGSPPPFIPIQLNRLISVQEGENWTQKRTGISVHLEPDEVFNLSKYFEKPVQSANYRVCAAIRHIEKFAGGHYTTVKRDPVNPEKWILCDDSQAKVINYADLKEELSQGYIYFLERIVEDQEDEEDKETMLIPSIKEDLVGSNETSGDSSNAQEEHMKQEESESEEEIPNLF